MDLLHRLAGALLEFETLTGDDIQALKRGETISPKEDSADKPKAPPSSAVPETDGHADGGSKGDESDGGMEPQPQG